MDYLEYGNIKNSVNYPDCDMGKPGNNKRIVLLHLQQAEHAWTVHEDPGGRQYEHRRSFQ